MKEYELSIVATSRNDNHGGDCLNRTQHFINSIYYWANHFKKPVELILVEWNPPAGSPLLKEVLSLEENSFLTVRIITVPQSYHGQMKKADALPLFQYLAKNVGIRRAQGRMVLATNIDIVFTKDVFKKMLFDTCEDELYRVDRYDVVLNKEADNDLPDTLAACKENIVRINTLNLTCSPFDVSNKRKFVLKLWKDFLKAAYDKTSVFLRPRFIKMTTFIKIPYLLFMFFVRAVKRVYILFSNIFDILSVGKRFNSYYEKKGNLLHTNACGDFTLLSKKNWDLLQGYPEFQMYSWHIDSLFLYQAFYNNIKNRYLTFTPIYHIEHSLGSGWSPEGANILFANCDAKGIAYLTDTDLERERVAIIKDAKTGKIRLYNDENWGAINENLEEFVA